MWVSSPGTVRIRGCPRGRVRWEGRWPGCPDLGLPQAGWVVSRGVSVGDRRSGKCYRPRAGRVHKLRHECQRGGRKRDTLSTWYTGRSRINRSTMVKGTGGKNPKGGDRKDLGLRLEGTSQKKTTKERRRRVIKAYDGIVEGWGK